MNPIRTYNVEAGLPALDEARRLVIDEIKRAKREGVKVLKVIHGYALQDRFERDAQPFSLQAACKRLIERMTP